MQTEQQKQDRPGNEARSSLCPTVLIDEYKTPIKYILRYAFQ